MRGGWQESDPSSRSALSTAMMSTRIPDLMTCELEDLLDALRRDMRAEERQARSDPELADHHLANVRRVKRILEVLRPKVHHKSVYEGGSERLTHQAPKRKPRCMKTHRARAT